ncbi:Mannan endo-1-4-beta-mannosidase 7 [Striga hermonthica]|uniref:mannan endo-1,4-beta-mannosidase n=1 Tax=Striga hermonthica TaxID=68872 RepID=A0A9N7NQZ4_STRHE|nr:Mannan endo-1-4-beta-mannosidase 7 [Striga hermonthica]
MSLLCFLCLLCLVFEPRMSSANPGFVQTRGTQFVLDDSSFMFNGFNAYWMMHIASQPNQRDKVSNVFREAAAAGLTVCRTWAFSDGGDEALQISPGVYNEYVFQALDFVVSEAAKNKIRLILSLSNNYQDFGGRSQYVSWAKSAGAQTSSDDDFYTNEVVKDYYKKHVQRILNRINTITGVAYKDDPTIMAWELINEPRCQADYSGDTVNAWVQEMASHVKSIDSKHLLEVGMEGFYGDSFPDRKQYNPGYQVGTDFITTNLIEEIDFTTIHAYPDAWLPLEDDDAQMVFMRRWMTSHWRDSKTLLKKPMVFTEFGKSSKDKGFSVASRDSYMNAVYGSLYSFARGGGIGGGLVWQILDEGMESYSDGYEIVLSESPSTSSIISQQSRQMTALQHMMSRP